LPAEAYSNPEPDKLAGETVLPTFVIGLREGLEASLIVGIVAAFLAQQGRRDALKWVWVGVILAVVLCAGAGVALNELGKELPQAQQEGLETVVGVIAVGAVTWMIFWMKSHGRMLAKDLRDNTAAALATGSVMGLVVMAFLSVLREGLETAVFLLAAFNSALNPTTAAGGAILGLIVAVAVGYGIYKGGIELNLTRFFKVTGVLLAFVAAGVLSRALHTAHEAGWFNGFQTRAVDLTPIVKPGTVTDSLFNGIVGLTATPTVGELAVYLLYLVPVIAFVLWPAGKPAKAKLSSPAASVTAAAIMLVGLILLATGCGSNSSSSTASTPGTKSVAFTISDEGCNPATMKLGSGPTTFHITNSGSSAVTELELLQGSRIVGEAENVAPGIPGKFTVTLQPGGYSVSCPNGTKTSSGAITVSGQSQAASAADDTALATYRKFLIEQTALLTASTKQFTDAVIAGDTAKAKELFASTRAHYEAVEPVAEAFGNLDPRIDARVNDVAKGDAWTGFHKIEQALWKKNSLAGMAPIAKQLQGDVEDLQNRVKTVALEPAQIANGAVDLLGEVAKSKITGEEDRYSHTDLSDFKANIQGAQAAFVAVTPILAVHNAALVKQINEEFANTYTALKPYETSSKVNNGFITYTDLTAADKKKLSAQVNRLAEPLSQVPAKVVG
jgi:FTR1 family protein